MAGHRMTRQQAAITDHLNGITVDALMSVYFDQKPLPFTTYGIARALCPDKPTETRVKAIRRTLRTMADKGLIMTARINNRYIKPGNLQRKLDVWATGSDNDALKLFICYWDWMLEVSRLNLSSSKIPAINFDSTGKLKLDFMRYPVLYLIKEKTRLPLESWVPEPYAIKEKKLSENELALKLLMKAAGCSKKDAKEYMKDSQCKEIYTSLVRP